MSVVDFDTVRIRPFVERQIEAFISDPPDSEFQYGFLSALLMLWREGMRGEAGDARIILADRMLRERLHS